MIAPLLTPAKSAFVWIWLPAATEPVVCGRIDLVDGVCRFTYGRSYLARKDAIPVWLPELPLQHEPIIPAAPHLIAGAIRDAAPDQWGRRVILNRQFSRRGQMVDTGDLDEMNYLLLSGSERVGALDFQASATQYIPRMAGETTLAQLMRAADAVEQGLVLSPELEDALRHGTSIGGARPKAQLVDGERKLIAKFASSRDLHDVVRGEYIAMRLAKVVGLSVATVELASVEGKDVLLVERFDRLKIETGYLRRAVVSALTVQDLNENAARYASYPELAKILRRQTGDGLKDRKELWSRMQFNILVGNTDDHARNHAVFWDGSVMRLTPAYDIDPRPRLSREANQAMAVNGADRRSRIATALDAVGDFGMTRDEGIEIAKWQVTMILLNYRQIAHQAGLASTQIDLLARSAILNPYVFDGAPPEISALAQEL